MIRHVGIMKNGNKQYLCNQACGITEEKICRPGEVITCKNCVKMVLKYHNSKRELNKDYVLCYGKVRK